MQQASAIDPAFKPSFNIFMSVKQVADSLHLNEKNVYALVSEEKTPATKELENGCFHANSSIAGCWIQCVRITSMPAAYIGDYTLKVIHTTPLSSDNIRDITTEY